MLSQESLNKIDIELAKYPAENRRSATMSALRIAQQELGWLSNETMEFIASYLRIPATQVMEVATFYGMYNLKPVGKYNALIFHVHYAGELILLNILNISLALKLVKQLLMANLPLWKVSAWGLVVMHQYYY